jgi:hypothetical protein
MRRQDVNEGLFSSQPFPCASARLSTDKRQLLFVIVTEVIFLFICHKIKGFLAFGK